MIVDMDQEETVDTDQEGIPSTTCCFCVTMTPIEMYPLMRHCETCLDHTGQDSCSIYSGHKPF